MTLVEVSIIAGAILAGGAALQHFYDRYARNGLYKRSLAVAVANGEAIRNAVEGLRSDFAASDVSEALPDLSGLQANLMDLPNKIQAAVSGGIVEASTKVMQAQLEGEPQIPPGVQAMGTDAARDRALTKSLKMAVGADMLGPYGGILSEFAPAVFAWLQEHPDSVQWALSQPWLQGVIKRASQLVAQAQGGASSFGKNPFLTE